MRLPQYVSALIVSGFESWLLAMYAHALIRRPNAANNTCNLDRAQGITNI
jgi:hypothetical protein